MPSQLLKRSVEDLQTSLQWLRDDLYPSPCPPEVKIVCSDNDSVYLHRMILVAASPIFKEILINEEILNHEDTVTVIMPDFDAQVVEKLVRYLYGEVKRGEWKHPILECLRIGAGWKDRNKMKETKNRLMSVVNVKEEPAEMHQSESRYLSMPFRKDTLVAVNDCDTFDTDILTFEDFEEEAIPKSPMKSEPNQSRTNVIIPDPKSRFVQKKDGSWRCVLCSDTFLDRRNFKGHYEKVHSKFISKGISKVTPGDGADVGQVQRGRRKQYVQTSSGWQCLNCQLELKQRYKFQNHKCKAEIKTNPKKGVGCAGCGTVCQDVAALKDHLEEGSRVCNDATFVCDLCDAVIYDQVKFNLHKREHAKKNKEDEELEEPMELEKNEETPESGSKKHKCPKCPKAFDYLKNLMNHIENHEKLATLIHKCVKCDRSFNCKSSLHYHLQKHETPSYSCTKCPRSFKSKRGLKYHLNIHDGITDFLCHDCGKGFITKQKLLNHRRSKHTFEKPFICDQCGEGFFRSDKLVVHKRRAHTGEKPYKCELCEWRGVDSSGLIHHKKKHISKPQESFPEPGLSSAVSSLEPPPTSEQIVTSEQYHLLTLTGHIATGQQHHSN